jgi:hypothetical protein
MRAHQQMGEWDRCLTETHIVGSVREKKTYVRTYMYIHKVVGSIPDGVTGIFH